MWRILLLTITCSALDVQQHKNVHISNGNIRGKLISSYGNHTGYGFLGIPFAQPPVGNRRFKRPIPAVNWTGTMDATKYTAACIANPVKTFKTEDGGPISEDCLYLNVFSSQHCLEQGNCAVMAVVHGGTLKFESPVIFRKDVIINNFANEGRNVVVVTIAFRLGLFGWFNLAPGLNTSVDSNIAIRDILLALEWVQKEIRSFGGDSKRVTLMGHSSGASLVQAVSLSPKARGLFHQTIIMSAGGSGGDISAVTNRAASRKLAELFRCAGQNETFEDEELNENIIRCVRDKPALEMLDMQERLNDFPEDIYGGWVDGDIFPDYQFKLSESVPRLNTLVGTVTGEMRDSRFAADENGNAIPSRLNELCTHIGYGLNYEHPEAFVDACEVFYGRPNTTQMLTDDVMFYMLSSNIADSVAKRSDGKAYMYSFSYADMGGAYAKYQSHNDFGPNHSQDFIYIFGLHRLNFTEKDYEIEKIYSGMLANFVNTGDPSYDGQKWENWHPAKRNYFHIDFDQNLNMPGMQNGYHSEAATFFNGIAPRAAGPTSPLVDFPPKIDCYVVQMAQEGFSAKWTNQSHAHDKTYEAELEIYDLWSDHVKHLRRRNILNRVFPAGRVFSEIEATTSLTQEDDHSWSLTGKITLATGLSLIALVGAIGIVKCVLYKKREHYDQM